MSRSPRSPGHVLIRFDLTATDAPTLLTALGTLEQGLHDVEESAAAPDRDLPSWAARVQAPRVLQDRRRPTRRARLAVRGLDRDPHLSRRVVDRLERHQGVRARANPLTARAGGDHKRRGGP